MLTTLVCVAALLGSAIGVLSAIQALLAVGGAPTYSARLWAGWAALILAALTGAGGLVALRRPGLASGLIAVAGLLGAVAINLFYINTFYVLAVPFWLVAAMLGLLAALAGAARE